MFLITKENALKDENKEINIKLETYKKLDSLKVMYTTFIKSYT